MKNINHFLFIFLISFVLISTFSLSSSALSIPTGFKFVGNGNGFFDNENSFFNLSVDTNIFIIVKDDGIYILEPLTYATGGSGMYKLVDGTGLLSAVVGNDGYLYFSDANGLYKDKVRSATTVVSASDIYNPETNPNGYVLQLVSGMNAQSVKSYGNYIYYIDLTHKAIRRFNEITLIDESVLTGVHGSVGAYSSIDTLTYAINGGDVYWIQINGAGGYGWTEEVMKNSNSILHIDGYNCACLEGTGYIAADYLDVLQNGNIYLINMVQYKNNANSAIYYIDTNQYYNGTGWTPITNIATFTTPYIYSSSGAYGFVGSKDQHFLHYSNVANSSEVSIFDSKKAVISTNPAQIVYDTDSIFSLYDDYANNSKLEIGYNIDFSVSSGVFDTIKNNYVWKVEITNPDNFKVAETVLPAPDWSGIFTVTCKGTGTFMYDSPTNGWENGTYQAHLYEINITTNNKAELDNAAFQIQNTSVQPAGSGTIDYSTSTVAKRVSAFLNNNYYWAIMIILICLGAGAELGSMGILIGGGVGIISTYMLGLIPSWVLFTFVIMVLLALAMKGSERFGGGGGT